MALGLIFMFCVPVLIFGGIEGVGYRFHVLRFLTRFPRYPGRLVPFSCLALPNSFSAVPRASGPGCMFCSRTRFRRYHGRKVPFSCFALEDSFSTVPRVSCLVFVFCAPGLIFGGTEYVGSRFHILRSRTHFRLYRGLRVPFHVLRSQTHFRRNRERQVSFSCFARPDSFLVVSRASGPVFMSSAPELIFGGTEGVGSLLHVLRSRTHFRR
jgi:hypothetical protein